MTESGQKTIVGVFALSGMTLLFVMTLIFGGGRSLFERTYKISVRFDTAVDGVTTGQPVTVNGKRIGETRAIEFWSREDVTKGIRVIVAVDDEYDIPRDARVEIAPGLIQFGRPPFRIVMNANASGDTLPRDGTGVLPGAVTSMTDQMLPPDVQRRVERVMEDVSNMATAMKPVAENLDLLLEPRSTSAVDQEKLTANFATVVERFDQTLQNFNAIIADEANLQNFRDTLANAKRMSEEGATAMVQFREFADQSKVVAADATQLLRTLTEAADRMTAVLGRLDLTLAAVNNPKGTIGSLLNDNRLYEELLLSARRLTNALNDVREVLDIAKKGQLRIKAF